MHFTVVSSASLMQVKTPAEKIKIGRTSLPLVQTCPRARLRGATGRIAPVVTPAASSGGEGTPQPVVCLFTVRVLCMTFCDVAVPKPHLHAALSGEATPGLCMARAPASLAALAVLEEISIISIISRPQGD